MTFKTITRSFATAAVLAGLLVIGANAQQVNKRASSVAGSTTQVQFNDAGVLAGDAGLTYDKTVGRLTSTSIVTDGVSRSGDIVWSLVNSGLRLASTASVTWNSNTSIFDAIDTGLARNAAGVVEINNGTAGTFGDLKTRQTQTSAVTVATLQTCNAGNKGARSFVTDANATTFLSTVAAGGANNVPVVCNGTNWVIG